MRTRSICIVAAALAPAAAAGPSVVNGDFATGDLTGWTWTPDAGAEPSMAPSFTAGPFGSGPTFTVNPGSAASDTGSRGGTLSQVVTLTAGALWRVAGSIGIENLAGGPNADGGTITVRLGGADLLVFNIGVIAGLTIQAQDFVSTSFVPPATGPYTLEIHFGRDFPNFVPSVVHYADNITLVPSPGALALAPAALLLRRRR